VPRLRDARRKLTIALRASDTNLTKIFGVGPLTAAPVIGDVRDVSWLGSRDWFAACNCTTPIEVSSGNRTLFS
jgi:transposase